MGIPIVEKNIRDMGLTEEDIERMSPEIDPDTLPEGAVIELEEGRAPAIDLQKLFGNLPLFADLKRRSESQMRISGDRDKHSDRQRGSSSQTKESREQKKKYLSQYCTDLTKKAAEGKLDKVVGRDREIERVIQILCRRQKNNPCLIGEPGVGKTAIAEALAQRIASGNVPFKLRDKELHLVDMTALVAGTQFRGQFETRMKGLIDEVKSLGNIILVIDEIHSIVGAGDAEGSMNAANILKPALSRGDIQVIGATTLNEYRKYIEKDAALTPVPADNRRGAVGRKHRQNPRGHKEVLRGLPRHKDTFGDPPPRGHARRALHY